MSKKDSMRKRTVFYLSDKCKILEIKKGLKTVMANSKV